MTPSAVLFVDPYPLLKLVHILSATVLFGTGLGSAFFLRRAYRHGDVDGLVAVTNVVTTIDRVFIAPSVVVQLLTGVWLAWELDYSLLESWILAALVLYFVAGGCWLPAVWLQQRMHIVVSEAETEQRIPGAFRRYMAVWTRLGVAAFVAVTIIFYLMVFKPRLW